jgi:electron transfer flavoprotein beta subunit
LNIVVCIKQVPDTTDVKINPETNTLIRDGVASIINPFDVYAIEESLRLREKFGGIVNILSMGPPQVDASLREAISLGADEAYLLTDRAFAGSDTLATAYTLSAGIRKLGPIDIILMGRQAIDGDTGQVGPEVAENLGIPHLTDVKKIESIEADGTVILQRTLEEGYLRIKVKLPIVVTVVKEINEPRLPSLRGKMNAKKKEIAVWNSKDVEVEEKRLGLTGSPTQVIKIFTPPKPSGGKVFEGSVPESVSQLLGDLEKAGILFGRKKGE